MRRRHAALVALALAGGTAAVAGAGLAGGAGPTEADLVGLSASDRATVLQSARWQRLARRPDPSLRGLGSAHSGSKVIRVSRSRKALTSRSGRQRFPYPRGTVVVKTGTEGGELTVVAIMRKVAAGRAASSWRYVEYLRSGAGSSFQRVSAPQSLCIGCHQSAADEQRSDYVFFRLTPPRRR